MFVPALKDIFDAAKRLPVAPQRLAELINLLDEVNINAEDIVTVLESDSALAAGIIRLSNCSYYGVGGIGSVFDAIQRVGFGEVHRLVASAWVGSLSDRTLAHYGIKAEALCEHMVCTALAAEALASETTVSPRCAYTAGLLRPLGMIVLDRFARGQPFQREQDGSYSLWESKNVQHHHDIVTAIILNEWRFSREVVEAVRGHSLAPTVKQPSRGAYLLNIAGWMAQELGKGLPGERELYLLTPQKLARVGLKEEQVRNRLDEVAHLFGRMHSMLLAA